MLMPLRVEGRMLAPPMHSLVVKSLDVPLGQLVVTMKAWVQGEQIQKQDRGRQGISGLVGKMGQ